MKVFFQLSILHFAFCITYSFAQPGWEIIPAGINTKLNSIYFYDYEVGYAVGDSGTVIKSIDSGKTWQTLQTPSLIDLNDLYIFTESSLCVVGNQGTLLYSGNGGSTWTVYPTSTQEDLYSVSFAGNIGISGGSSQTILWGTYTGTGIFWVVVQTGFFGGGFFGAQMLSQQIGFVAGENSIFQPLIGMTSDGGVNWNFSAFYLNNNEGRATGIDFTDINIGYISAQVWNGTGAISQTTDSGVTWSSTLFPNAMNAVNFPISNASQVGYTGGNSGTILKTYDAGINWVQQNSGTTYNINKVFFIDVDFGFAVGENGMILRTTTGGEPVTNIKNENQFLISFQLFQNFPNPFNPSTKIRYVIPNEVRNQKDFSSQAPRNDKSLVTLKVFDILGNEVATLVNEELPAGEYEVEFSAKGGSASGGNAYNLPSGIYFYQLKAGAYIQSKKMILLK